MQIDFAERFIKQLRKAPKSVQKSARERIEIFASDRFHPLLNNHVLSGKYQGYRSINITGDWRAVFRMIDNNTVYFEMLGTHSQLYK
ncbi:hypothetical protein A3H89_03550 [Candidatus Amesbacteria bacterium RIFCSPLOWO2_02_FULL_48_11]|uniref:Type II toxin-antitoxin system mRNA interferase toxin, RelE/StbE family n=1 Tax=Candidatus Amesbacteria bacterium RIFCSPHIGHO2_12_FULL_48_14 TaxID=1797257 RepID=A0A1F4Z6A3_9BACT|nr:MAG: hypothetical protein A3C34_00880 [Candidatus Amesbacteria bacterium RIFCSPHIGHO2_02_FULL_48_21]OGC99309.1 MAG: hypothetical protein A2W16_03910 [Candidatus Amesbacteria bacterium RBG_16_48_31]OGD01567.1 MAG: hypothetical protein A3E17_01175 [Candidatus Amesbacteria bacterium RIFCSPHIGHO2_12_FULL_48_14]OGD02301.1 MAG: hypothetical protein A2354_03640 [Candidatus Amesbacteria bacterium RIFOXYB1_FULL_47_12]OGD07093.1 MAG: hypothetical protein A3B58_00535 [Candidatus Amesbacteria bacterium 